ncbi:MAG: TetR/AcrR family transcriptional regulator [Candidatus Nanopelagicaceae bacterium]|nr:TetR/AcrR family transcriptional regulator [Candidatus Nanopelagicaceae bacterium]
MLTPRSKGHDYHHGDLRASAIAAGREMIKKGGINALGLRKVAERLQVSPAALYRHFEDVETLQAEICAEVRQELGEFMLAVRDQVPISRSKSQNAKLRFRALGHAYMDFANKNKKLFESAFLFRLHSQNQDMDGLAWNLLNESLDELRGAGELLGKTDEEACMLAWSAVHGLATLVAQDAIPPEQYELSKLQIMNGVERALTGKVSKNSNF